MYLYEIKSEGNQVIKKIKRQYTPVCWNLIWPNFLSSKNDNVLEKNQSMFSR